MSVNRIAHTLLMICVALVVIACGGGGTQDPAHFTGEEPVGIQGNLSSGYVPSGAFPVAPVSGSLPDAPLGTDPAFGTQEMSDVIETNFLGAATSSLKGTSEDRLFWIAVVARGEDPIEGNASPPVSEGDEIDLYMRYQVFESQLTISRNWYMDAAGLDYIEPTVAHDQPGIYEAIFEFTLPFGSANTSAVFNASIGLPRNPSAFVVPDQGDWREVDFEIVETQTLAPIYYPSEDDIVDVHLNDHQGGDGGNSTPDYIIVTGINGSHPDGIIYAESEKDLSNVVLYLDLDGDGFSDVEYKYDDLDQTGIGNAGTFDVPAEYAGADVVAAAIKSGNNKSGKGSGYGFFTDSDINTLEGPTGSEYTAMPLDSMAQFCWEDRTEDDNDFNDFVGRLRATELRDLDGNVVQVFLSVKAVARSTFYDADWQLNIDGDLPGNTVYAIVDQFYANGTRHGDQRIYLCSNGMSVPIFTPIRNALPNPSGTYYTNGIPGTDYMDGDYAEITLLLENPQPPNDATPMPFDPELLIDLGDGNAEIISLWQAPGDPVEEESGIPLAFIVPDTYAWPLEDSDILDTYLGFSGWVEWINGGTEPSANWWDAAPESAEAFDMPLFN